MTGRCGSGPARCAGQTNPWVDGPADDATEEDAGASRPDANEVQPASASRAAAAALARRDLTAGGSRHGDDRAGEGEHLLAGAGDGQVDADPAVIEDGADLAAHRDLGPRVV